MKDFRSVMDAIDHFIASLSLRVSCVFIIFFECCVSVLMCLCLGGLPLLSLRKH